MGNHDGFGIEGQWDTVLFRHIELKGAPCLCLASENTQALRYGDGRWPWMSWHQSLGAEFDYVLQLSRVSDRLAHRSASL
jgi:hypothetical protein